MPTNYFGPFKNGYIEINNINLSDHAREFSLETSVEELPANAHGDSVAKQAAGIEDWTVNATFLQDFAAGEVDATLSAIGGACHVPFDIVVGADSVAAVSASNPRWSGEAILSSYRPLGGTHGALLESTATFRPGSGSLTRLTS